MGIISSTRLGTSSPLNLNRGFGFFPANTSIDNPTGPTTIGVGALPNPSSTTLLNVGASAGIFRFRISLTGRIIAGAFFGYNLGYTVSANTDTSGLAQMQISQDSARGGAGLGFGATLTASVVLDRVSVNFTFRRGFQTSWINFFNFSSTVIIDFISLGLRLLQAAGFRIPLERIAAASELGAGGAIWGLYGSASGQLGTRGSLTFRPKISISGNILQFIPQLRGVLKAVKNIGGKLKVGPVLGIEFPVTIRVVRLTTPDGNYDFESFAGQTISLRGPAAASNTAPIGDFSIVHTHGIGINFTLEIKASFSIWRLYSASASLPVNVSDFLPIPTGANELIGPFFATLNNSQNLAHAAEPASATAAELPEVVWG